jgi:uncharacterized protein (TIGR02118 family)
VNTLVASLAALAAALSRGPAKNGTGSGAAVAAFFRDPAPLAARCARRFEEIDEMVRFLVLYDQPEDPEAFDRHYREVHIPLARKLPGLRRYTISRGARSVRGADSYYLVAELDWDDIEALQQDFQSPEGQATAADVEELAPEGKVRSMIYELEEV